MINRTMKKDFILVNNFKLSHLVITMIKNKIRIFKCLNLLKIGKM